MKLRKLVSLTALLAFAVLVVTGIVLYAVPQGRVANWAEWRLLGFTKEAWGQLHILISLLFLVAGLVHIWLNWRPIVSYLKDRSRQLRVFTPEFVGALVLTALFVTSAILALPPLSWVLDANAALKDAASRTYGEPPYGHAEMSSLADFARRTGLDLERAKAALRERGIEFAGERQTLAEIARGNDMTPQQVYQAIAGAAIAPSEPGTMPAEAPPGTGRKTLAGLCAEYGLDAAAIVAALEARGLAVDPGKTMRAIAEDNGTGPHDLYDLVRQAAPAR